MEKLPAYYTVLFNAITNALEQLEKSNFGIAKDILYKAQEEAEELYITEAE